MKKFFSTPARAIISIICIVVIVLAIIAAVIAIIIKSSLISKSEAEGISLNDAGFNRADVSALYTKLDFDDGRFQYEVDFYKDGTEYEYTIQAKDGDIISRDIEGGSNASKPKTTLSTEKDNTITSEVTTQPVTSADNKNQISLDEAKAAALADAKLSAADVTFTKAKSDNDDGIMIYDIEFYTKDKEYDYEINAYDGTVYEKGVELISTPPTTSTSSKNDTKDNYIGIDRAKKAALDHAKLSESNVRMVKSELDYDNGKAEYEIEFYFDGKEYDYKIDAVTGSIIEHDVEPV